MKEIHSLRTQRRVIVVLIYTLSIISGIESRFGPDPLAELLISLGAATFLAQFCMIDARIRGQPLPWSVPWLIFFFWPLAVPAYLFRSRGIRQIHRPVLAMLAFLIAPVASYVCASLAAQ